MSMSALLRAVVLRIRAHADFANSQVEAEIDRRAPATAADDYIIVSPGPATVGPTDGSNRGEWLDELFGVDVTIALRSPQVPRDRQRGLVTGKNLTGVGTIVERNFETIKSKILLQLERDTIGGVPARYVTINAANSLITAEEESSEGFIEPLRFEGTGPTEEAPAEIFAGTSTKTPAALIKTLRFRGARRMQGAIG